MDTKTNLAEWAKNNPSIFQISYPRSGREWLNALVIGATGMPTGDADTVSFNPYQYLWFYQHGGRIAAYLDQIKDSSKFVLLIRDPRDAALSDAYRRITYSQHPEITEMSTDLIGAAVKDVITVWPRRIQQYKPLNTYIVIYEALCLWPVEVMSQLLEFCGVQATRPLADVINKVDETSSNVQREPTEDDPRTIVRQRNPRAVFDSGLERYRSHSMKWLRDCLFANHYSSLIYNMIGKTMAEFGYTEKGHDKKVWGEMYGIR